MVARVSDDVFAQQLIQAGVVTLAQLDSARQLQRQMPALALADALIKSGVITPAIRENIETWAQRVKGGGLERLGHYKLIRKLGEGGMGAVYLAQDLNLDRQVAVKVLPRKFSSNENFTARFRREAKAAARLLHHNIVGAYDAGEDTGFAYYVMEYCDGETLHSALVRAGKLPVAQALTVATQIAQGLQYAHANGFIHRDIKPANLMLTRDGMVKILDLGLSKNIAEAESSFNTVSGIALGTPQYISPEQARGDPQLDGRTDIYSLGATLFHFVIGRPPYDAPMPAVVMSKHLNEPVPRPLEFDPELPQSVADIIQRCMAKKPAERYRDCGELLADLQRAETGKPVTRKNVPKAREVVRRRDEILAKRKAPVWMYGVAGALALGGFILFGNKAGPDTAEPPPMLTPPQAEPAVGKPLPVPVQPVTAKPAPPAAAPAVTMPAPDPREEYAARRLAEIRARAQQRVEPNEIRTLYQELADRHGHTKAGQAAKQHLAALPAVSAPKPVQPTPAARESGALLNGGFEQLDGSLPKDWKFVWGKQKAVSVETEQGNHFLRFNFPQKEGVLLAQRVKLDSRWAGVTVSARLRGKNVQKGAPQPGESGGWHTGFVQFVFYSAQNKLLGNKTKLKIDRDQDWTLAEASETIPAGAMEVELQCVNMNGSGIFDFDDITLLSVEK